MNKGHFRLPTKHTHPHSTPFPGLAYPIVFRVFTFNQHVLRLQTLCGVFCGTPARARIDAPWSPRTGLPGVVVYFLNQLQPYLANIAVNV